MKHQLTEKDLEQIFINSRVKKKNSLVMFLKFFLLFVLFFLIILGVLNFSAYKQKITYWYQDEFFPEKQGELSKAVLSSGNETTTKDTIPNISDNSLYIESINVKTPITFRVPNDATEVSENLKKGLIQIEGTSLPGEKGNVFITGHSSNYPWIRSDYNSVFALLDKLVIGDLILIKFQNTNYIYQIRDKFITPPTNISVLNADDDRSTLTLMTCTPIGTNLRRLIIRAEQIVPDPTTARPSSAKTQNLNLPEGVH